MEVFVLFSCLAYPNILLDAGKHFKANEKAIYKANWSREALKRINFYGEIFKWISNQTIDEGWWNKFQLPFSFHASLTCFFFFSSVSAIILWFATGTNDGGWEALKIRKVVVHRWRYVPVPETTQGHLSAAEMREEENSKTINKMLFWFESKILLNHLFSIQDVAENCKIIIIKHFEILLRKQQRKAFYSSKWKRFFWFFGCWDKNRS